MQAKKATGGIPPLLIIMGLTIAAFLIYFAIHSAVQNRFQILYTEDRKSVV